MRKVEAAVTGSFDRMNKSMENVNSMFTKVQGAFTALAGVVAGGAAFKGAIDASNKWTGEAVKLSKALGITTEQASILNVALNSIGVSSDTYTQAATAMSRQLNSNAQAFDVLGVKTRDSTGHIRPATELMGEVNEKLKAIKNPLEQNIAGQQVYGRQWQDIKAVLKLTTTAMDEAAVRAKELGLIVGPEGAAMAKQYQAQMRDLDLVGKSLSVQFGNVLLPVFTRMGSWLSKEGPIASKLFGDALNLIAETGIKLYFTLQAAGTLIGGLGAAAAAVLSGNFSEAKTIVKEMSADIDALGVRANQALEDFNKPIKPAPADDGNAKQPGPLNFGKPKAEGEDKDKRMAEWEAALAARRDVLERQSALEGTFHEFGKADESKYWKDILDSLAAGDEKRSAVERKYYGAAAAVRKDAFAAELADLNVQRENLRANYAEREKVAAQSYSKIAAAYGAESKEAKAAFGVILQERRSLADQTKKIDEAAAETRYQIKQIELETERRLAQTSADLARASAQEKLQIEQRFLEQRTELERADILRRMATIDPQADPEGYAALKNKLLQIDGQYQAKKAEIDDQAKRAEEASWMQFQSGMESGFASVIQNFAKGTMTISGFFSNMGKAVLDSMVSVFAQIGARWLATQVMMIATQAKASAAIVGAKSTEAGIVVAENAAEAGSGAAASMASIPWVGPVLAIAAMAAVFAAVSGLRKGGSSSVPSAAGGFDIPAGLNPMTQLHEREMVLPAKQADVIRGMADDGGAGVQAGGDMHLHIQALDGASVLRVLTENQHHLAAAIRSAARNNHKLLP